jgi:hypothetical protein
MDNDEFIAYLVEQSNTGMMTNSKEILHTEFYSQNTFQNNTSPKKRVSRATDNIDESSSKCTLKFFEASKI